MPIFETKVIVAVASNQVYTLGTIQSMMQVYLIVNRQYVYEWGL